MNFKHLVLAAVAALGIAACEKPVDLGPANVSADTSALTFTQEGGQQTITLNATIDWALKDYTDEVKEWVVIDPESGKASKDDQQITIKVLENTGADRSATITFYGNVLNKAVLSITQAGPTGDGVEAITIAEFISKADANTTYKLTGKASGYSNGEKFWGFDLQDETGKVSCPFPANWDDFKDKISNGDQVTVTGPYQWYESKSAHQVKNCTIVEVVKGEAVDPSTIQTISCAEFISKADALTDYRLVGKVTSTVNTSYCSFDMSDDNGVSTVVVWTVNNKDEWKDVVKKDGTVTVRGKYLKYESNGTVKHEMIDAYIEAFEEGAGSAAGEAKGTGTEADPYNATAALAAAKALAADTPTTEYFYIKGFVSNVKSIDTGDYGNANFYITDTAANDTEEFYCFQIMYIGGAKFTASDQIKKGDEVVVYAQLVNYKGNTPETNGKGTGKLISVNGSSDVADYTSVNKTAQSVSYDAGTAEIKVSSTVAWTAASSSEDFALSTTSGEGDGVITVTYTANPANEARTAVVTITSSVATVQVTFTQAAMPEGGNPLEAKEGEVLHALTLAEIKACMAKSTSAVYTDKVAIESEGGNWTGSFYHAAANTFLQFRNNNASYLTSPEYSSNVKRIVIVTTAAKFAQSQDKNLRVAALPKVDPAALPTGKGSDGKNINYGDTQMEGAYGSVSVNTKGGEQTLQIDVTAETKQFSLLTIDGAMYLDAIYVFCTK